MAKSFKDDMRNQMLKNISLYNLKDSDAPSYQSDAFNDVIKVTKEMGESKSAKNKFRQDLKTDPDYNEFKKRARYRDEFTKDDFEYGTPNAMDNDPFIKKDRYQRVGKNKELEEKWSEKYKNSIDCNNPKGFSQKAHCQGKKKKENNEAASAGGSTGAFSGPIAFKDSKFLRNSLKKDTKKVETKEATGSSSTGSYSQPSIWAKSMSKKNFRGYDKPMVPGGKFVTIKKKCKKFPYCNQGDIKALKIFESEVVKNVIKNLAKKHNLSESYVKFIIQNQMGK
jgi:hypothetical protein